MSGSLEIQEEPVNPLNEIQNSQSGQTGDENPSCDNWIFIKLTIKCLIGSITFGTSVVAIIMILSEIYDVLYGCTLWHFVNIFFLSAGLYVLIFVVYLIAFYFNGGILCEFNFPNRNFNGHVPFRISNNLSSDTNMNINEREPNTVAAARFISENLEYEIISHELDVTKANIETSLQDSGQRRSPTDALSELCRGCPYIPLEFSNVSKNRSIQNECNAFDFQDRAQEYWYGACRASKPTRNDCYESKEVEAGEHYPAIPDSVGIFWEHFSPRNSKITERTRNYKLPQPIEESQIRTYEHERWRCSPPNLSGKLNQPQIDGHSIDSNDGGQSSALSSTQPRSHSIDTEISYPSEGVHSPGTGENSRVRNGFSEVPRSHLRTFFKVDHDNHC